MIFDNRIKDENEYDINRETAKISALSLSKTDNMNILQVKNNYRLIKVE